MFRLIRTISLAVVISALVLGPAGCKGGKHHMEDLGDCTECHKLGVEEADTLLKVEAMKAEVKDVRMSPANGFWEVEVLKGGRSFFVYVDFGKKYLIEKRAFVSIDEIGKPPPLTKVDVTKIPLGDAVVMGDAEAKNKVIVFDDPDCPFCRKFHEVAKRVVEEREDVVFYLKLFPLPIHPEAYDKSRTIICKGMSLELLEDAFAGKELPAPDCEAKEVDATIALAKELGIGGTPTIIFPDGRMRPGAVEKEAFLELLDNPQ